MWQIYCQTISQKKSQSRLKKTKTETPAAAKYTKEKQQKRIWKNPRLYRRSSTKLVSRLARQSKRRIYLLRAQQALSLTVPLSYHISIIYSALPSYQPCSAHKCQKLPHISPSMQTASGKGKKCSLLQNIHHAIHLWRCTACSTVESEFWWRGVCSSDKMLTASLECQGCDQGDVPGSTSAEKKLFFCLLPLYGPDIWKANKVIKKNIQKLYKVCIKRPKLVKMKCKILIMYTFFRL